MSDAEDSAMAHDEGTFADTLSDVEAAMDGKTGAAENRALGGDARLSRLFGISVKVQVVLGSTRMAIGDLVQLGPGSVVALDQKVGEPVDILVNDRVMAHGEIVMIGEQGDRIGISLTKVHGLEGE